MRKDFWSGLFITGGVMIMAANLSERHWYNFLLSILGVMMLLSALDFRYERKD